MKALNAKQAQIEFQSLLNTVQQEPILIQQRGKPVAVVISLAGFEQLQALEDSYWMAQAQQALQEGLIGTPASEQLLKELLNAED